MSERSAAIAWRARWAEVNEESTREARAMSPIDRLRTLARLRAFAASHGVAALPDDEPEVWTRFELLRTRYRARHASR